MRASARQRLALPRTLDVGAGCPLKDVVSECLFSFSPRLPRAHRCSQVCIFAFGQTGTGKTHTMMGSMTPRSERGITPRAVDLLFNDRKELEVLGWKYKFRVSRGATAGVPYSHKAASVPGAPLSIHMLMHSITAFLFCCLLWPSTDSALRAWKPCQGAASSARALHKR